SAQFAIFLLRAPLGLLFRTPGHNQNAALPQLAHPRRAMPAVGALEPSGASAKTRARLTAAQILSPILGRAKPNLEENRPATRQTSHRQAQGIGVWSALELS